MGYDFNAEMAKDEKKYGMGGGSGYYDLQEGNGNVVRVLTPGAILGQHFFGKGVRPKVCYGEDKGCPIRNKDDKFEHGDISVKYYLYVLDRADGGIKIGQFPYSVMKQIGALQKNPDYAFEDLPMTYDLRITYNKAESPANMYKVDVKPASPELTEDQLAQLQEKMSKSSPEQIVERMKNKQMEADREDGSIMSPEQIKVQREEENLILKAKKDSYEQEHPKEAILDIEYPTAQSEGINPEDTPF